MRHSQGGGPGKLGRREGGRWEERSINKRCTTYSHGAVSGAVQTAITHDVSGVSHDDQVTATGAGPCWLRVVDVRDEPQDLDD